MTCFRIRRGFVCINKFARLRLADGRCVFVDMHYYGPTLYRDRLCNREIERWYEDGLIVRAVNWFIERGCVA